MLLRVRQVMHKGFQPDPVFFTDFGLERSRERPAQALFPAGTAIVQICPPAGFLACRIDMHPNGRPHNADQVTLGHCFPAANTRSLGDMAFLS